MIDLFKGTLFHKRFLPKQHQFKYSVFFLGFNIDTLASDIKKFKFFGFNSFNLFSIYERDYLKDTGKSLRDKLDQLFLENGFNLHFEKIILVSSPRCLGKQFNPVNFYYCYQNNTVTHVVAEVNNTFKQRHTYILENQFPEKNIMTFSSDKQFYVSPFFDVDGHYDFKLSSYSDSLSIVINYLKESTLQLHASLVGSRKVLSDKAILFIMLTIPWSGIQTFIYILFEAFRLKFLKSISIKKRGKLMHKNSYKSSSLSFVQSICKDVFLSQINKMKNVCLTIHFPSGLAKQYGDPSADKKLSMKINDHRFYTKVCFRQEMGLGEAFVLEYWESENVKELLATFLENKKELGVQFKFIFKCVNVVLRFQHFLNRNSVFKSKKNIHKHYDLGNDFFESFLDPSMLYSCAIYPSEDATLSQAQQYKMDQIIDKLNISPGMNVLEIGSGWGSMAIEIVKKVDCKLTTVTISKQQYNYVKKRIEDLNLTDKITILYQDYRYVEGEFDRVVSIEMIEAVGHKYLPVYFNKINQLLNSTGKALIQAITIRDDVYDTYKRNSDWIRKYIFPGGHLPSVGHIKTLINDTNLSLSQADNIGLHYVKTLEDWKCLFFAKLDCIKKKGFDDEFIRKWHYYFEYSQAGFMNGYIQDFHLVFDKK